VLIKDAELTKRTVPLTILLMKTRRMMMEIRYIPEGTITEEQQKDVDVINSRE
jgi:hypothetical protein